MKQEVLVLQDLGIPQEKFDELVLKMDLAYEFVREQSDFENIVGIITIKTKVDEMLLSRLPNVRFVAVAFTGYDAVDLAVTKRRNILVFNVPVYATDCTAELAVGLAISLLREIPKGNELVASGGWDFKPGHELAGKTVGIIGTGVIGIRVAELFKAFRCKLIGWSRSKRKEFISLGGVYVSDFGEVFKKADIVSIHLLLSDATRGMVARRELAKMKRSAYLINVARGSIVNTGDLVEALKGGLLAGAAVDVFDVEPIEKDNPLLKAPNVILTPHIAYKTEESLLRRVDVTLKNIKVFSEGMPQNVVG